MGGRDSLREGGGALSESGEGFSRDERLKDMTSTVALRLERRFSALQRGVKGEGEVQGFTAKSRQ